MNTDTDSRAHHYHPALEQLYPGGTLPVPRLHPSNSWKLYVGHPLHLLAVGEPKDFKEVEM